MLKKYGKYTNNNNNNNDGGGDTSASDTVNYLESVVTASQDNNICQLDARESKHNDTAVGGVDGRHLWVFSRLSNTVDLLGTRQPITIIAGAKVDVNGIEVEKNVTGNSWNASFYSQQAFDPLLEDFAVSWLVENVTGTVREMGGLDGNPAQNNSYTSLKFAVYQVNNYFYSSVYENGAANPIPNYSTFYLQVGDRIGIKCINQTITYFVLRGGIENVIYTSLKKAESPLYFKGAFNRGNSSSGHSVMGSVEWHVAKKPSSNTIEFSGYSLDTVSSDVIELGRKLGLDINTDSKYSDVKFTKLASQKFLDTNGNDFPLDLSHGFFAGASQSIGSFAF